MKKFIAMLLVVVLTCSNFIGFGGSDTVYASQDSSGLNEVETKVTSATDVSAEKTEITGQGTITDVHVNPLYEDSVEVQSVHYASLDYATSTLAEPEYVADLNVIVEEIREAMLARNNTITVYYKQMGELGRDFLTGWLDLVMVETDNPKAGDYLERHYSSAGANGQYIKYESGLCEYTLTIRFTYYTTAEQEAELDERVAKVLAEIGVSAESTDYENVKKIYDYMCGNITYDYDNLNDESYTLKYTAYAALINKTAVCQGYASLFYYMARLSDLNVRTIRGNADNGVSVGRHGWNIVKLGDWYYYLDSTWDAGTTKYSYFLKGSDNFTDHMSDEAYETDEFTSLYPISEKDYVPATIVESGNCGANGGNNVNYTLDSEGTLTISGTGILSSNIFRNRKDLRKLIIKEGITEISSKTFYGCSKLTGDLVIPEGVTNIGYSPMAGDGGAFQGCTGFDGKLMLPESLKTIGYSAFENCNGFKGDLVIPDSVTYIGGDAFRECTGLTGEVIFPESVAYIGGGVLYKATGIDSVVVLNRNCEYPEGLVLGFDEHIVVKGYCGSTTETFARTYNNIFSPIHVFSSEWSKDSIYHWHDTICEHATEINEKAKHLDNNNDDLCDVCSFKHEHVYDQENTNLENALKSQSTCTSSAVYYKSCVCGKLGTETFAYGTAKGHSYATEWSKNATYHWYAAVCEHTAEIKNRALHVDENNDELCDVCKYDMHIHVYNQKNTSVANALVSKATCTKLAVYLTSCICGELGTVTFEHGAFTEHVWGEWKIIKQPTTSEIGLKRKECTKCDAYEEQLIDYLIGQWMHDGVGWWYRNADGSYPANSWKDIEGARYYFNGSGYMVTGWQLIGGTWYYFSGSGAMVTGWQAIGGTWYYFNGNGVMVTGWQLIGGIWYYLSGSGAMVTGWQAIGGTWYYFHGSGAMATGWQLIGGTWYYFVGSGAMVTGWQEIGNIWYYFQGSGAMAASQWVGNYYLQADGSMAVNKRIGVYYVGNDGAWVPGV